MEVPRAPFPYRFFGCTTKHLAKGISLKVDVSFEEDGLHWKEHGPGAGKEPGFLPYKHMAGLYVQQVGVRHYALRSIIGAPFAPFFTIPKAIMKRIPDAKWQALAEKIPVPFWRKLKYEAEIWIGRRQNVGGELKTEWNKVHVPVDMRKHHPQLQLDGVMEHVEEWCQYWDNPKYRAELMRELPDEAPALANDATRSNVDMSQGTTYGRPLHGNFAPPTPGVTTGTGFRGSSLPTSGPSGGMGL